MSLERRKEALAGLYLLGLLLLCAYLRFANLRDTPGWDADEGYNLSLAQNLAQGRAQLFALRVAYVDHPELFFMIVAQAMRLLGPDILTLRRVTAACGVLTALALYAYARPHFGRRVALLSVGIFTIFPLAVIYNRLGYGYNLLMLVTTLYLAAQGAWLRGGRPWAAWLAAGLAGLGLLCEREGICLGAALLAVLLWGRRFRLALGAALVAVAAPVLVTALLAVPRWDVFVADLGHAAGRAAGDGLGLGLVLLVVGYGQYLGVHAWVLPGLVGLCLVRPCAQRRGLLALLVCMLLVVLKVRDVNPFFRTAVPTLPLLSLGVGTAIQRGLERAYPRVATWWSGVFHAERARWRGMAAQAAAALVAFVVLFSPLGGVAVQQAIGVQFGLRTALDPYLARDIPATEAVVGWVNARVAPDDVVLASPRVAWAFHCRAADFLQALAFEGATVAFYPPHLPAERFAFAPSLATARYVVEDSFLRRWAEEVAQDRHLLAQVAAWPVAIERGEYRVYSRPA